jgi:hypothetical protein
MSYWVLIKFPYFMDTTKIGVRGWKEVQRQREVKVNFWISLLTKIDIQVENHLRSLWRKDGSWMDSSGRHDAITHCAAQPSLSLSLYWRTTPTPLCTRCNLLSQFRGSKKKPQLAHQPFDACTKLYTIRSTRGQHKYAAFANFCSVFLGSRVCSDGRLWLMNLWPTRVSRKIPSRVSFTR